MSLFQELVILFFYMVVQCLLDLQRITTGYIYCYECCLAIETQVLCSMNRLGAQKSLQTDRLVEDIF